MDIRGTTAIVTGASAGIGRATALALARHGAHVWLLARSAATLATLADEIMQAGGSAAADPVDLTDPSAVEALFDAFDAAGVQPDLLVNSAGAGRWLTVEETSPDEAVAQMAAPYFAAFFVTHRCLPGMLKRRRGHIVMLNSPVAWGGWPGAAGYTASRYAMRGLTTALRYDLHGTGVGVTSVTPGRTDSEYFDRNPGTLERFPRAGRLLPTVTPEQVAAAVVDGVRHNRREVILPFMLRMFLGFNIIAPWLMEQVMQRSGWQRPRA